MLKIRARVKAVIASAAVALITTVFAPSAFANTVAYFGHASGQPRVLVGVWLTGPHCPKGPHCFDHAKVTKFDAFSYRFPNCPNLLEGGFEFGNPNTGKLRTVKLDMHQSFSGRGGALRDYHIKVSFHGRFLKHGSKAKGWFESRDAGCSTGRLNWSVTPGG